MKFSLLLLSLLSVNCYGLSETKVKNWKADLEFYSHNIADYNKQKK